MNQQYTAIALLVCYILTHQTSAGARSAVKIRYSLHGII